MNSPTSITDGDNNENSCDATTFTPEDIANALQSIGLDFCVPIQTTKTDPCACFENDAVRVLINRTSDSDPVEYNIWVGLAANDNRTNYRLVVEESSSPAKIVTNVTRMIAPYREHRSTRKGRAGDFVLLSEMMRRKQPDPANESSPIISSPVLPVSVPTPQPSIKFDLLPSQYSGGSGPAIAIASLNVSQQGEIGMMEEIAEGNGPVDAMFRAINDVVSTVRKDMSRIQLTFFRISSASDGWDADGTASVKITDGERRAQGSASDPDIVIAAAKAYLQAINAMCAMPRMRT